MLAGYPIKDEIETAVKNVFNKANFILGEEVSKFEKDFAAHNGTKYAVGVANGTDALRMAFLASGIKAGDEIITSPFTFIATTETISQVGAIPVFADIDPVTYNLDPKSVEKKITNKTRAIVPVHLYGMPCDMDAFMALAKKHNLRIIEDTAQAFTGKYKMGGKDWKYLGSIGDCGTYSFFPAKNLGAFGDGGAITTSDDKVFETSSICATTDRCATTTRWKASTPASTLSRPPCFPYASNALKNGPSCAMPWPPNTPRRSRASA